MTPRELLADLTARGVVLTRNGDKLKAQALPGVLTDEDKANLARYKMALLSLLDPSQRVTFEPLTLNEIADGILDRMGFEVDRFDNDLRGQSWNPTIHVRPK
jgi:hypothetical protein